jgi:hypothetical protein
MCKIGEKMANISVQINTDGPRVDVSIDGVSIPNVNDISVYNMVGENGESAGVYMSIYTTEVMQNGVVKQVNYYASGSPEAEAALATANELDTETIPGFVGVTVDDSKSRVRKDIEGFFSRKS